MPDIAVISSNDVHPSSSRAPNSLSQNSITNIRSPNSNAQDILQAIIKTRKSWKTLKGHSEAVWPPYLEAAMLAGLQEYEPDDSRETRILGRFPMRNRFISDYIYRTTGKYRTAKQVGSRLQQLRDTSEGRELMDSLTSCYHRPRIEAGRSSFIFTPHPWATTSSVSLPRSSSDFWASDSSSSTCSSPISPSTDYTPLMSPQPEKSQTSRTVVCIDVLPEFVPWTGSSFQSQSNDTFSATGGNGNLLVSGSPRPMRNIDPTVTFVSPSPISAKSSYIVLLDGAPIHSEDTRMQVVDPANTAGRLDGSLLYSTTLVPNFWDTLCQAPDPTQYTILQDVFRIDTSSSSESLRRTRPVLMFSALYKFQYPTTPVSPTSTSSTVVQKIDSPVHESRENKTIPEYVYPFSPLPFSHFSLAQGTGDQKTTLPYVYSQSQSLPDSSVMLDVNFDDVDFNEFTIDIQDSPESVSTDVLEQSSYCFPTNLSNYLM